MRKLSAKWVPKCQKVDQKLQRCRRLSKFGIFSARSKCFPVEHDWWSWTKPSYITMTRRRGNNQLSGGIGAHPSPKNSECKSRWKSSHLNFLGSRRDPPHWLSSKGPNYQRGVLLSSAGAIEGHFEEKTNAVGRSPSGSCSYTTMPRLTGHLQPRRNWHTWASSVLITHPILRIWPRRTTACSLDWKKQLKARHFSSDVEVIAAVETWLDGRPFVFFFLWLAKGKATG